MAIKEAAKFEVLEREKNQPIHQWVYQNLRFNIIRLHLFPGQAISETEVSDRLGISRTPVREAFIRLAEDGLLEVKPQKWSSIPLIDLEQAEEARFVRLSLEKSILAEACLRFPRDFLSELELNIALQNRYLTEKDFDRFLFADDEFHRIVYRGCGKERIWSFIKKLYFNYDRLRIMTLARTSEQLIRQHRDILTLIAAGNGSGVDATIEEHLTNKIFKQVVLEYPEGYFKQDSRGFYGCSEGCQSPSVSLE